MIRIREKIRLVLGSRAWAPAEEVLLDEDREARRGIDRLTGLERDFGGRDGPVAGECEVERDLEQLTCETRVDALTGTGNKRVSHASAAGKANGLVNRLP